MASTLSELRIVLLIMVRVYRYRIKSRLRWTEEMIEGFVDSLREDVKNAIKINAKGKHIPEKKTTS